MTKQPAQIVAFPFQVQEPGASLSGLSDSQLIWEWKMRVAKYMNLMAARGQELDEQDRQEIQQINAICIELGYAPIHVDF